MNSLRLAVSLVSAALLPAPAQHKAPLASYRPPQTDFAGMAAAYQKAHGLEGKNAAEIDFQKLLDEHYAQGDLGVLDVRFPIADVGDKQRLKDLQDVAGALLDVQLRWLDWAGAQNEAQTALRKDLSDLKTQIAGVHLPSWGSASSTVPRDLVLVLGLKDDASQLATRAATAMRGGAAFGVTPRSTKPAQFVVEPTRKEFYELASFIGWLDEKNRPLFWASNMPAWSEFYWFDLQVIPLQYPPGKGSADDLSTGVPMNGREPTGMVEFVAQRGAQSVTAFFYGQDGDAVFESALSLDIVIDVYKENNARTGTASHGRETQAFSTFIPGGLAQGGTLPAQNADCVWRAKQGSDRFIKELHDAQKSGAKETSQAKSKIAYFEISSATSKKSTVAAPFLGSAIKDKELPAQEFLGDYVEFFRAYKSCFAYWLRTEGSPKGKKASEKLFQTLLTTLASRPAEQSFESVVASVYGMPYSAPDDKSESLEWRFLNWLSKQH
jgi:hypothetical protein